MVCPHGVTTHRRVAVAAWRPPWSFHSHNEAGEARRWRGRTRGEHRGWNCRMAATATGPDPLRDAAARDPSGEPTSSWRAAETKMEERTSAARATQRGPPSCTPHSRSNSPRLARSSTRPTAHHTHGSLGRADGGSGAAPMPEADPSLPRPDRRYHQPGAREGVDAAIARGPQIGMPRRRLSSRVPEGQRRERRDSRNRARVAGARPGGERATDTTAGEGGPAGGSEAALDLRTRVALGT